MENTHSELGYLIKTTLSDKEKEGLLLELVEIATQANKAQKTDGLKDIYRLLKAWEHAICTKTKTFDGQDLTKQKILETNKFSDIMDFSPI